MQKIFKTIGITSLLVFSFIYTQKTVEIVKTVDDLMIQIKEDKDNYCKKPIDAVIIDNTIIPGLNGREVDIDLSYDVIKKIGKYSPNLLVFKSLKPNTSIHNNYDKYIISGNKTKKEVTLIIKVNNNIDNIINILNTYNVNANFFMTTSYISNNTNQVLNLLKNNHNIGYLDNDKIILKNTIIKKEGKQKYTFCYIEDNKINNKCIQEKSYTIKPNIIIKNNPLIEVKKSINSGSIISFEPSKSIEKELPLIIKYIQSRGYNIVNLVDFIKE